MSEAANTPLSTLHPETRQRLRNWAEGKWAARRDTGTVLPEMPPTNQEVTLLLDALDATENRLLYPSPSDMERLKNEAGDDAAAIEAVTRLLLHIGEDPMRDGLINTPGRVVRALEEMTRGYYQYPQEILGTVFEETQDELIILRDIKFHSLCEHHLLGFHGTVAVGYLPGKVVGISKLARLVECYARRLQIQERMTRQIAEDIEKYLDAKAVGVVIKAHHSCMGCRGVMQADTEMITSTMLGRMRDDARLRAEFLTLSK